MEHNAEQHAEASYTYSGDVTVGGRARRGRTEHGLESCPRAAGVAAVPAPSRAQRKLLPGQIYALSIIALDGVPVSRRFEGSGGISRRTAGTQPIPASARGKERPRRLTDVRASTKGNADGSDESHGSRRAGRRRAGLSARAAGRPLTPRRRKRAPSPRGQPRARSPCGRRARKAWRHRSS
jgi:hypothetical protein